MQLNALPWKEKEISDRLAKEFIRGYEKEACYGQISNCRDSLLYHVITYVNDQDGSKTTKIYINRLTGIPEKFEYALKKNGQKEVTFITLSEILINRPNIPRVDTRIIPYLDQYTLLPVEDIGIPSTLDTRDSLIGKKAPEFVLKTQGGKSVALSDLSRNGFEQNMEDTMLMLLK